MNHELLRADCLSFPRLHLIRGLATGSDSGYFWRMSRVRLVISLGLVCSLFAPAAWGKLIPAASPNILIEGRSVKNGEGGVKLGFPGTAFHLRVRGNFLKLQVNASTDEVYFDIAVDNEELVRLRCHAGSGEYPLLKNAVSGDHDLIITRRTESWQGVCEVKGFEAGAATQILPPPALPLRKLMFIGDSITCGAATDIRPDDPLTGKTAHEDQTSDANYSFGKVLARRLHAQCHLVSYGGRGLIRDWKGSTTINNAPSFYGRALPDDPSSPWNPGDYVPDALVICLGQNDFNQGVPDEIIFVNAYAAFVRSIRRDAPHAKIFLADSPMIYDPPGKLPKRSVLHAYILETIEKLGDSWVRIAPVKHYEGVPNNGHPSRADHEAIASEIEPLLREALQWKN